MILIVLAGLCLLSVPMTGGRLALITRLPVRGLWIPPLALALQLLVTTVAPGGARSWHAAIHIATYGLIGVFLLANRHLPGVALVAAGTLLNAVAIVANGGVIPASATAQRIAGLVVGPGFSNSAHLAHPQLAWLGDLIPVPGPLPNVLSPGDLIIFAGLLVLLHRTCRRTTAGQTDQSLPGVQI